MAGRIAWLEEYVAAVQQLAVAELKEKLASAEDDFAEAEAAGNGAATLDAKDRIEVIQAALLALHDDD